ncbi:hypothetical protein MMC27_008358 [Xylographa pallens]|nr:hypothetical protein [Xylographa pallens]
MGAPKPPKPARQKKPKKDRRVHLLEDVKPVYSDYNDCVCDLLQYLDNDARKAAMKQCNKNHEQNFESRETARRSTVIIDLEESDSEPEQIYASFAAVEVPRLPKPVKQKKAKKARLSYPSEGSKSTPNLWDNCVCDLEDSDGNPPKFCAKRDLLMGIPCPSLTPSRGAADLEGNDPESSEDRVVSAKKLPVSVSGKVKDTKEVRGKKRKLEESTAKPDSKGPDADLSRRRKPAAVVASPPSRSAYDPRTLASDILRAAGRHPTLPPLNWKLMQREVMAKGSRHAGGDLGGKKY